MNYNEVGIVDRKQNCRYGVVCYSHT